MPAGRQLVSEGGAGMGADGMGPSSKVIVESAKKHGVAALLNVLREFPTRVGVQWRALNVLREMASESGALVSLLPRLQPERADLGHSCGHCVRASCWGLLGVVWGVVVSFSFLQMSFELRLPSTGALVPC